RSEGSSGAWTVIASGLAATATSYTDNSVTAGTTYSYRVQAFADSTASDYSNVATATVPAATPTAPAAPTNLAAAAITSPAGVQLTWTANATNATSYVVERYSGGTGVWTVVASNLAGTATSYTDTAVTSGTFYTYRVKAVAGTLLSDYSNSAYAIAPIATPAVPAAPSNLKATASPAAIVLSWTDNATNATSYSVERSAGTSGVWTVIANNLAATATGYTDSGVTAGTTYSYRVQAFAGSTASAYCSAVSATAPISSTPPAAPTNLTATAVALQTAVKLTWTNNAANATSLSVERYSGGSGRWAVVASNLAGAGTSYLDTSVKSGTFYTYRIRVFNGTVASAYSNTACATAPKTTGNNASSTSTVTASLSGAQVSWNNVALAAATYAAQSSDSSTDSDNADSLTSTSYVDQSANGGVTIGRRLKAAKSPTSRVSPTTPAATPRRDA
ncbi:MAG: fibronectin type III domain-containing protein, partial [Thermoguttaceae bacterium]